MVQIHSLWLPILLSTVLVYIASSLIWAVLKFHATDVLPVRDDRAFEAALGAQGLTPGLYSSPGGYTSEAASTAEFKQRMQTGPIARLTVVKPGSLGMGQMMAKWVLLILVISITTAYVAGRALPPGTPYLRVFQIAGTVAAFSYGAGHIIQGIFWGRPWGVVWKEVADGVLYGLLTAGCFGWLWPR